MLTWPGGVNYPPAALHHAGPYDVVVVPAARCPIYADLRPLELFRTSYMLIDVQDSTHPRYARCSTRPITRTPLTKLVDQPISWQAPAALRSAADCAGCGGGHPERTTNRPDRYPNIIHRASGKIMTDQAEHRKVELSDGDRVVASARVTASPDAATTARVSLHAESGHLPTGSRARLVDAVLDLPELQGSTHLEATVPLGDSESLQRLRERTNDMTIRGAGSSALVNAALHPNDPPERHTT